MRGHANWGKTYPISINKHMLGIDGSVGNELLPLQALSSINPTLEDPIEPISIV